MSMFYIKDCILLFIACVEGWEEILDFLLYITFQISYSHGRQKNNVKFKSCVHN